MKIIVTCGPSYEPLDGARRLTNMSTGALGLELAGHLSDAGHQVICMKGEGSTSNPTVGHAMMVTFGTNADLELLLQRWARSGDVGAVFHAAALCDYRVGEVLNESGQPIRSAKYATRDGDLFLRLVPATKLIPKLRLWFPQAMIVGWKYELAGGRSGALAKAQQQMRQCGTDYCVVNGAAFGTGFGVLDPNGLLEEVLDRSALAERLIHILENRTFKAV